jgi:hypothetical protein
VRFIPVPSNFFIKEIYFEVNVIIIKHALLKISKNKDDQLVPEHQCGIKVVTTTKSYCH